MDMFNVCIIDLGVSLFIFPHSPGKHFIASENKSIFYLRTSSKHWKLSLKCTERCWVYFPLDHSGLISARAQCCVPGPSRRNAAIRGKRARYAKISMMRYWLLACNFILCTKWQTRYHTVHNPQRPWTHTHTHTSHRLLLVINGESKAVWVPLWGRRASSLKSSHQGSHLKRVTTHTCTHTLRRAEGHILSCPAKSPPRLTYVTPNLFSRPHIAPVSLCLCGEGAAEGGGETERAEDWTRGHRGAKTGSEREKSAWKRQG